LRLVLLGLGLLITVLVAGAILIARELHDSAQRTYADEVIPLRTAASDLQFQLVNEETGVRGYIITGRRTSLQPYSSGTPKALADTRQLIEESTHDVQLKTILAPLLRLRTRLQAFFRSEIRLAASGPAGRTAAAARVESGKTTFDAFRSAVGALQTFAAGRTSAARHRETNLFSTLVLIVGGAGIVALALVCLLAWRLPERAFVLLRGQLQANAQAERLRREAEALQSLTANLSSAVSADDVYHALTRTGAVGLGADALSISVRDPTENRSRLWTHGFPIELDDEGRQALQGMLQLEDARPRFLEHTREAAPFASLAVLPLVTPRTPPRGLLGLYYLREHRFSEAERARLELVAAQIENALLRADSYERERRTAETLQRALLPASLPSPPTGGQLVGLYQAGSEGALVGGDWYDAVERDDGTIAGSVGDVAGHGIPAAAQMGRLRHSYRAYALEHRSPAEILARLTRHIAPEAMATAICFDIDPATRTLRYCSAGHPPALMHDLERAEVTILDTRGGPPLGVAKPSEFHDTTVELDGPTLLFAYTDGLIENRTDELTARIHTLAGELTKHELTNLRAYVGSIVASTRVNGSNPDDLAVLAIMV
jgi:serine phosphatase RsbU (regulator of sigma subunit)/CHASE3 domain sensor protein